MNGQLTVGADGEEDSPAISTLAISGAGDLRQTFPTRVLRHCGDFLLNFLREADSLLHPSPS